MNDERMNITTVDICPCGLVMHQGNNDDYDTGGADSCVCCPDCGNEEFTTVAQLQSQLAAAQEVLRWRLCSDINDNEMELDKVVEALEEFAAVPKFMTMAEIFMDEGSDIMWWRSIDLPEKDEVKKWLS